MKLVVDVSAPVDWLPLVALLPLQPPEAVQLVALADVQLSVAALPLATLAGFAERLAVGFGATATDTVRLAPPPVPVHARV